MALADIYFNDNDFEKASKTYGILSAMATSNPDLDSYTINLRSGLCAIKLGQTEEAYKSLIVAKAVRGDAFEVNYNLGIIEYQKKAYEKAAAVLKSAASVSPEHGGTLKYLGQTLFKMKMYKEAVAYLRKAMDAEPNDKECLFFLAQAYFELGQAENAVQIFTHLRPDPDVGPQAALFAGTIHYNARQYDKAIEDLEIGVRHEKGLPRCRPRNAVPAGQRVHPGSEHGGRAPSVQGHPQHQPVVSRRQRPDPPSQRVQLQPQPAGVHDGAHR